MTTPQTPQIPQTPQTHQPTNPHEAPKPPSPSPSPKNQDLHHRLAHIRSTLHSLKEKYGHKISSHPKYKAAQDKTKEVEASFQVVNKGIGPGIEPQVVIERRESSRRNEEDEGVSAKVREVGDLFKVESILKVGNKVIGPGIERQAAVERMERRDEEVPGALAGLIELGGFIKELVALLGESKDVRSWMG